MLIIIDHLLHLVIATEIEGLLDAAMDTEGVHWYHEQLWYAQSCHICSWSNLQFRLVSEALHLMLLPQDDAELIRRLPLFAADCARYALEISVGRKLYQMEGDDA